MKKLTFSFNEVNLITSIIKESDPLESFRKGYLTFLDSLTNKLEEEVKSLTEGDTSKSIDASKINLELEVEESIANFLLEKINSSVMLTLKGKLEVKSVK